VIITEAARIRFPLSAFRFSMRRDILSGSLKSVVSCRQLSTDNRQLLHTLGAHRQRAPLRNGTSTVPPPVGARRAKKTSGPRPVTTETVADRVTHGYVSSRSERPRPNPGGMVTLGLRGGVSRGRRQAAGTRASRGLAGRECSTRGRKRATIPDGFPKSTTKWGRITIAGWHVSGAEPPENLQ
jgi:hypothetical protein